MVMTTFKGRGVGFGIGIGCGFGVGWGFGGAPIQMWGLGIGGGCGVGVGLGWGFGAAFGTEYFDQNVFDSSEPKNKIKSTSSTNDRLELNEQ